ncbi:MAG: flagellar biosynthesis repressor FlbT [Gammaproteobacteria bacterium]
MALKLTLKPGEKFVVNGAVIVNGDRRGHLLLQNNVSILREKDVMQPEDANTPVRRIYFAIQLLYLDESDNKQFYADFADRLQEFMGAVRDPDILEKCASILDDVNKGNYYQALLTAKKMFAFEQERLNYTAGEDEDKEMTPVPSPGAQMP